MYPKPDELQQPFHKRINHTRIPWFLVDENIDRGPILWNRFDLFKAYPGRQSARIIWMITGLILLVCVAFGVSVVIQQDAFWQMGLALALLLGVSAWFIPVWPVMIPGGQFWAVFKPGHVPIGVLNSGLHWIKVTHSIRPYRYNEVLRVEFADLPPVVSTNNIPFQPVGFIEFRFDPTCIQPDLWEPILAWTNDDLRERVRADIFEIYRKLVFRISPSRILSYGAFDLQKDVELYFAEQSKEGILLHCMLIQLDIPGGLANAYLDDWAFEARQREDERRTNKDQKLSPDATASYRVSSKQTQIRLFLAPNQQKSRPGIQDDGRGAWRNLTDLPVGVLTENLSRPRTRWVGVAQPSEGPSEAEGPETTVDSEVQNARYKQRRRRSLFLDDDE